MTFQEKLEVAENEFVKPYDVLALEMELRPVYRQWWDDERTSEIETDHIEMMNKLFEEKDRFVHIFETETGSVYFQTIDGCIRIMRFANENGVWKRAVETPTRHVYYITEETVKRYKELRAKDYFDTGQTLVGVPFSIRDIEVGLYPLEFAFWTNSEVKFEAGNGKLVILQELAGHGIHNGDRIVKIIK